jgi:hypothetical protein
MKMGDIQDYLPLIVSLALITGMMGIIGWIYTTHIRIKNGYPLENSWGKSVYPQRNEETVERVKDRLANVERIVTDAPSRLDREIASLRGPAN